MSVLSSVDEQQSTKSLSIFDRHMRIRASSLKMSHKHYLIELNMFLGDNAEAWPSQATIMKALSAGLSSVKQWQKELMCIGVIVVASGKGCRSSNTYRIDFSKLPMDDPHTSAALPPQNSLPHSLLDDSNSLPHRPEWSVTQTVNSLPHRPGMVCQMATKEHIKTQEKETSKTQSSDLFELEPSEPASVAAECKEVSFDQWYQAYPRRTQRGAALKAYSKALKAVAKRFGGSEREAHEFLTERAKAFSASDSAKSKEFIPYPATWLNRCQFDDEADTWAVSMSRQAGNSQYGQFIERLERHDRTPIDEVVF